MWRGSALAVPMSSMIRVLFAVLASGVALSAQNACFDPNCTLTNGSHNWICPGNGRCVSCAQCFGCAPGTTACGFTCCGPGQLCQDASKSACGGCAPGLRSCGGACTNVASDTKNCANCGNTCSAPINGTPTCVATFGTSTCGFSCNLGFAKCDDNCFNLPSDSDHCGSCDNECDSA